MQSQVGLQFSSVTQLCPTLCDPMYCSIPGFPVHYQLPELTQTQIHWVSRAVQPSRPLLRALGNIITSKASGGDGIPAELFQILKDDAVKVLHSILQQIWKTAVATGLEKVSFHSNPKERQFQRMFKLLHNCNHLTSKQSNTQNSSN